MEVTWLGHSCFRLEGDSGTIYLDPFIEENPACPISMSDVEDADWVLVTHGHDDHYSDAVDLASTHDATLVANFEITEDSQEQGHTDVEPMNVGGTVQTGDLTVHMTEAQHSSGPSLGHQAGFVLELDGYSVYHAGDTGLFSDMKLIGEFLEPELGLVPIGDRFTMGPRSAARAVEYLGVDQVIPMHYNTFEFVEQDPADFSNHVGTAAETVILDPGESHQLL